MKNISPFLAAAFSVAFTAGAFAQPVLVKDINTTDFRDSASPAVFMAQAGSLAYFGFSDGIHGQELWRSDGTAAGTRMVKDLCPGACSGLPVWMTAVGSTLYFAAEDGAHGRELWKSDGTEAGTTLVRDIIPGLDGGNPAYPFELNGKLFFGATKPDGTQAFWTSDGTEAGTTVLMEVCAVGCRPFPLGQIGMSMLMSAGDVSHGRGLWRTDGTPAGTVFVKAIAPEEPNPDRSGYLPYLVLQDRLYLSADDGVSGLELWATDGTEAGTVLVKDVNPGPAGSSPRGLAALGDEILFGATDPTRRSNLWKSDGTEGGTTLVKTVSPSELIVMGSAAFFRASSPGFGTELWKSDGTPEGTALLKDTNPGPASGGLEITGPFGFTVLGDRLLFFSNDGVHGLEPWISDGTEAGTTMLTELTSVNPAFEAYIYAAADRHKVMGGLWYFRFPDADGRLEIHVSDGTPAGTRKLAESGHQASGILVDAFFGQLPGPGALADLNGTLLFQGADGPTRGDLWKSDGSSEGTTRIADLGPEDYVSLPREITPLGSKAFFRAQWLFVTDGTEAGTTQVGNLSPQYLARAGSRLYFAARPDTLETLYAASETTNGTVPLHSSTYLDHLTAFGELLLFSSHSSSEARLWRTDGTLPGTFALGASEPSYLHKVGSRGFFSAYDESTGRELWVTDGTASGTARVKDILPGSGSGLSRTGYATSWPTIDWAGLDGRFVLFPADGGTGSGEELWISDGTATGTFQLADVNPGPSSSEIQWLTGAAHKVYFVTNDGTHGRELWTTDGTPTGTHLVADLVVGEGSSLPEHLWPVGTQLLYSAFTPDGSRELWITDGDAVGTRRLADIAPGALPSTPQGFTASGGSVYFVATDAETGFELYSIPREQVDGSADFYSLPPCRLVDTRQSGGPLTPGLPRTVDAAGFCGIPPTATALAVNVTAIGLAGQGGVALDRTGSALPGPDMGTNAVSVSAGQIRAGNAMVRLGSGSFVAVSSPETVSLHLVVDVAGYYE